MYKDSSKMKSIIFFVITLCGLHTYSMESQPQAYSQKQFQHAPCPLRPFMTLLLEDSPYRIEPIAPSSVKLSPGEAFKAYQRNRSHESSATH